MKLAAKLLTALLSVLLLTVACIPVLEQTAHAAAAYYIQVDLTNQIVTVYQNGNVTNEGIVRQMICSSGKAGTPTPTGTYTMPNKRYSSERTEWHKVNGAWATWASRIINSYLFHSVPYANKYDPAPVAKYYAQLGEPASMGCIRLRDDDAKWIALNCPPGTKVKIYKSGNRDNELRELLLERAFYVENETYDQYLGIADSLKLGSEGEEVMQLQIRLNLLGYAAGEPDGVFGESTDAAVRAFQTECGIASNGRVTERVWNRIFADDAPFAPIVIGSSGLHVKELQEALKTLKLYSGEITGVYNEATASAVRTYQAAFGMTVNGNATDAVRQSILAKAGEIKAQFGDSEYETIIITGSQQMAKVSVSSTLNLRETASTSSSVLTRLSNGAVVVVLQKGSTWSKVQYGNIVGYCKNDYLKFYTQDYTEIDFEIVPTLDPNATPTPTPDPNATPKPTASSETLTVGSEGAAVSTLQRALAELKLYTGEISGIFDDATAAAVKTFQAANGLIADGVAATAVQEKIIAKAEEIKAQFGGKDYEANVTVTTTTSAKVKVSSYLNLRQTASASSKSLGKLYNNTIVTVLEKGSTWSKVEYNGIVGYCKNTYLVFSTTTDTTVTYQPVPEPTPTPEPTATPEPTPTPDPNATPKPTASSETLTVGSEGAAVSTLQRALSELKLYTGEISGIFDNATAAAVKTFQAANGLTADGVAATAVQEKIIAKAEEIKAQFGGEDYEANVTVTTTTSAKVKVSSYLNLRQTASASSKSLGKLYNNTIVTVLEKGSTWSKVEYNGIVGYCKNTYLVFSTTTDTTVTYQPVPEPTPTPEPTATPEPTPTPDPNATPKPTASSETLTVGSEGAAVSTLQRALAELKLYTGEISGIFDEATANAVKTFQAANGLTADGVAATAVQEKIIAKAEEIKAQFGEEDYEANVTVTTTTSAKVKVSSYLNLRQTASASSKSLGKLYNNTVVTVLEKGSTWSKVEYNGIVGYCKNTYLVFSTTTDTTVTYQPAPTPVPTETPAPAEAESPASAETETPAPEAAETPVPEMTGTPVPTETPAPTEAPVQYAVVKSDSTNLYKSADDAVDNVLIVMDAGAFFEVIETDGDWIVIDMDGSKAYVPASAVSLTEVKPDPTVQPAEITAEPTESPEPTETPAPAGTPEVSGEDAAIEESVNLEEEL